MQVAAQGQGVGLPLHGQQPAAVQAVPRHGRFRRRLRRHRCRRPPAARSGDGHHDAPTTPPTTAAAMAGQTRPHHRVGVRGLALGRGPPPCSAASWPAAGRYMCRSIRFHTRASDQPSGAPGTVSSLHPQAGQITRKPRLSIGSPAPASSELSTPLSAMSIPTGGWRQALVRIRRPSATVRAQRGPPDYRRPGPSDAGAVPAGASAAPTRAARQSGQWQLTPPAAAGTGTTFGSSTHQQWPVAAPQAKERPHGQTALLAGGNPIGLRGTRVWFGRPVASSSPVASLSGVRLHCSAPTRNAPVKFEPALGGHPPVRVLPARAASRHGVSPECPAARTPPSPGTPGWPRRRC